MNITGQELVRRLLELPPIVGADGKRDMVTKRAIQEFTKTADWKNVDNWLRGIFDPQPQHYARLKQMFLLEKGKRQNPARQVNFETVSSPELQFKNYA